MVKQMTKPVAKRRAHNVAYYYETHPTEEDFVTESMPHAEQVRQLGLVLQWQMRKQPCTICENLGFYQTITASEKPLADEKPLAPDIALVKGVVVRGVSSWKIDLTGPAPRVVFEFLSPETWEKDLSEKPARYARMGVREYFVFDPNDPPLKKGTTTRLYGWHLDMVTGQMHAMTPDAEGRLWSQELESFLVADGTVLRLYDRDRNLRLTGEEAQARRADAEAEAKLLEKRRADAEAEAKLLEKKRADAEAKRADAEALAKRAETKRADAEAKRAEALAEKLRLLGIDPNQI